MYILLLQVIFLSFSLTVLPRSTVQVPIAPTSQLISTEIKRYFAVSVVRYAYGCLKRMAR